MNDRSFDSITRQTAGGISRRTSLLSLGAAGLAALAGPLTADADQVSADKKGRKKKKKNKPAPDLCAPQVGPCTTFVTNVCGDPNSGCQDSIQCCAHLGTCDSSGFFSCLVLTSG